MAESEGQPLAALMVFTRGARAWYVYGGSTDLQREKMPNYLLQWEAMRWARARGCTEYDLWGVPDEDEAVLEDGFADRSDGLWGVYRFKRGFGGEVAPGRRHPWIKSSVRCCTAFTCSAPLVGWPHDPGGNATPLRGRERNGMHWWRSFLALTCCRHGIGHA